MPLPDPSTLCALFSVPPPNICMTFPGGAELCAQLSGSIVPSTSELARQAFGMINAALAPLAPVFNIIDLGTTIVDCVSAIPDAILNLDPTGLIECAPNMIEALNKVLSMVPQLSIPVMIRDILSVIIMFLEGLRNDLDGAVRQLERLAQMNLLAQQPCNFNLVAAITCCQASFDKFMEFTMGGVEPLNRLFGLLNAFLALVPGVDPLPCLGSLAGVPTVIQDLLSTFIDILKIVRNILPGGLKLNLFSPKGANC